MAVGRRGEVVKCVRQFLRFLSPTSPRGRKGGRGRLLRDGEYTRSRWIRRNVEGLYVRTAKTPLFPLEVTGGAEAAVKRGLFLRFAAFSSTVAFRAPPSLFAGQTAAGLR